MALGAGNVTPMQMVAGYSVFVNGGFRVKPYFIERIEDAKGAIVAQAQPERAGEGAERAIDARNAFIMTNIMQDVVRMGTAARAMQLKRGDLGGKTGTTNDFIDAWFCGFGTGLVTVAWIGFDNPRTLGTNETGAQAALPMWMSYMAKALKGVEEVPRTPPEGVVQARINPETGLRASPGGGGGGFVDYFYQEFLPPLEPEISDVPPQYPYVPGSVKPAEEVKSQLF
jgi:penicillin-binding protein 1A